jgi:hypothetical protein
MTARIWPSRLFWASVLICSALLFSLQLALAHFSQVRPKLVSALSVGVLPSSLLTALCLAIATLAPGQSHAATLTTLVSFNGTNGAGPLSGLIADANGNLFGTTYEGGAYGYGTAVVRIEVTQVIPARTGPLRHGVGFA